MNLTLNRKWLTPVSTGGELLLDGAWECFTLELPVRDGKPGSAIPAGTYVVKITPSPKFGRDMPRLYDVPGRSGILIHWGNVAGDIPTTAVVEESDTEGCILVGQTRSEDFVGKSRLAFEELLTKIAAAPDCAITVIDAAPEMGVEEATT